MGKPKRELGDALDSAKKMRKEIDGKQELPDIDTIEDVPTPLDVLSHWVRHTTGLRHRTKLRLQDAVDGQKKKARYGLLLNNEPGNEQEIVERGINLVLVELGYLDADEDPVESEPVQDNAA